MVNVNIWLSSVGLGNKIRIWHPVPSTPSQVKRNRFIFQAQPLRKEPEIITVTLKKQNGMGLSIVAAKVGRRWGGGTAPCGCQGAPSVLEPLLGAHQLRGGRLSERGARVRAREVEQVLLRGHGQGRGWESCSLSHRIRAPPAWARVQGQGDHLSSWPRAADGPPVEGAVRRRRSRSLGSE